MELDLSKHNIIDIYKAIKKRANKKYLEEEDREYLEYRISDICSQWMSDASHTELREIVLYGEISLKYYHDEELVDYIETDFSWLIEEDERVRNILLNFAVEKNILE